MKAFAAAYRSIDGTTKTHQKLAVMREYFLKASSQDAAWAVYFLSGERFKRVVPAKALREWALESASISEWLFEESYGWVGDLAETISLLVPSPATTTEGSLTDWIENKVYPLRNTPADAQRRHLHLHWQQLGPDERFIYLKLITGGMRVGVSKRLVIRAIAEAFEVPIEWVAHRLTGTWEPTPQAFESLKHPGSHTQLPSQPYPFCLANPIDCELTELGHCGQYQVEWKWDGIRAQLIKRQGRVYLWTRGEERAEEKFGDVVSAAVALEDGTVLDGELLAWKSGKPLPFSEMQKRIGRKTVTPKLQRDIPVAFMAYDLLEWQHEDMRGRPLNERRVALLKAIDSTSLLVSAPLLAESWEELAACRQHCREVGAEGLMLKRLDSPYQIGRTRGAWWKWKIEPYTVDAVLIYAQKGHGRRSSLFTDYTFAVWDGDTLVPFAKAYSGLSDAEIRQVDRFIKTNIKEKFGPVRSVVPTLVMELAFEDVQYSSRHRSGIAVRFPRILRWRQDKKAEEANRIEDLRSLVQSPKT